MFHVDWILTGVVHRPDPAQMRRPGLLKRGLAGREITPDWPLPGILRSLPGRYPTDGSRLDATSDRFDVPDVLGAPGSDTWAVAAATFDEPLVAIPIDDSTVRLVKVFELPGERLEVVYLDLRRLDQGRHRPTVGELVDADIFEDDIGVATEFLRETLEDAYLRMDPNFRDRVIRADGEPEPKVMLIAGAQNVRTDTAAVAATYGMAVRFLPDNIARDIPRLKRDVDRLQGLLAAVVLWEPNGDGLVFVGDVIAAQVDRTLPRLHAKAGTGDQLRSEIRAFLSDAEAGSYAPKASEFVYTCERCQPTIAKLIREEALDVATEAAPAGAACLCEGHPSQSLSIGLRLAVKLAGIEGLLIVGWQPNFNEATRAVTSAHVRHLRNAGDEDAAARRADLAVIVIGSQMGHSESTPYLEALEKQGVTVVKTSGNQLRDVIRAVIDQAVVLKPDLRRHPHED
jgi:hypothetical protein